MGVPKNTKTKNAIFSLNRRCFPSTHKNQTPICLTVHWNDDLMLLIFYFHNEKTSPVFRWTGRILGRNDTKEVNTCDSDDFDPEFCESRGYVSLSSAILIGMLLQLICSVELKGKTPNPSIEYDILLKPYLKLWSSSSGKLDLELI